MALLGTPCRRARGGHEENIKLESVLLVLGSSNHIKETVIRVVAEHWWLAGPEATRITGWHHILAVGSLVVAEAHQPEVQIQVAQTQAAQFEG